MSLPSARELPDFSVRYSARARRIRLSVCARDGLVVTLPTGVNPAEARRAVEHRRDWAARSLQRVAERREQLLGDPALLLPDLVELRAIGLAWPVDYRRTAASRVTARESGSVLAVTGALDDAARCRDALRRWRDRCARTHLPALLAEVSRSTGIGYERVTVRGQRTRWGSCSTTGTISLNRDLIFLPSELARYVLVHELAHRVHPNHSPRFHALLESLEPRATELRTALRTARDLVPVWADG
jgi:hypothetical protein